jgi:hypothetical protein
LFFIQTFILVIAFRDYRYNNMVSIFTARSESKYRYAHTRIHAQKVLFENKRKVKLLIAYKKLASEVSLRLKFEAHMLSLVLITSPTQNTGRMTASIVSNSAHLSNDTSVLH